MLTAKTFFSYSRDDSEFVLKLAKDLRAAGADVWLDQLDIGAGKRWDAEIETALESSQGQLVILSPSSVESHNVMDEVSYALEKGKHVIPIVFKECQIPFRLKRLQYIDFTSNYDTGFNQLLKALDLKKGKEPEKIHSISDEEQKQKLEGEVEQKRNEKLRQESKLKPSIDKISDPGKKKSPLKIIIISVIATIVAIIIISQLGSDGENYSDDVSNPDQDYVENGYATLANLDDIKLCTGIDEEGNAFGIRNEFYAGEEVIVWANVLATIKEDVRFEWVDNNRSVIPGQTWSVDQNRSIIQDSQTFMDAGTYEVILYNSQGNEIGNQTFTIITEEIEEY